MPVGLQPPNRTNSFNYIELGRYFIFTMKITDERDCWIKLAAFIDGEGSISIKNLNTKTGRYSQLFVAIANTDPRLPMWCKEHFGGLLYGSDSNAKKSSKQRRYWRWITHSAQAEAIIRGCLPYFLLKREQAEVALAYRKTFRFKGGKGSTRIITEAELAIRQGCREELHRLKREIPEEAFINAPLPGSSKETIQ